jgi:hypothetical protein
MTHDFLHIFFMTSSWLTDQKRTFLAVALLLGANRHSCQRLKDERNGKRESEEWSREADWPRKMSKYLNSGLFCNLKRQVLMFSGSGDVLKIPVSSTLGAASHA